jgi:16S rRNA (cytosine1402-N4)-methyltransferase
LVEEIVEFLAINQQGAFLDLTAGLGGHLRVLAETLGAAARLYGLDIDESSVATARENLKEYGHVKGIYHSSYVDIPSIVEQLDDKLFDGILLDLGLSSYQLDDTSRGFSFQGDAPLDMRFDRQTTGGTAADLINSADEAELIRIIRDYGEERQAARMARMIISQRQTKPIETAGQLVSIIDQASNPKHRNKARARVFQALRIAVNDELNRITAVLPRMVEFLKEGGRMAVISYHSLEDRLVKRFLLAEAKDCICPPELPGCVCSHSARLKVLTRRVVVPGPDEIATNSRARSARLRVAERLSG